jgi:hypothetical protein
VARRSTNALTLAYCKSQGILAETLQHWKGRVRRDLFEIADTLAIRDERVIFIQNCHYGSLVAHRRKIAEMECLPEILAAGVTIELWEWKRKKAKRGGKRMARHWWLRTESWGEEPSEWRGPMDL